jgi:hypothetical protein
MLYQQASRCDYNVFRREYWFGMFDSQPLSLFRIVFSLLLLKDALYHLPLAGIFYSDNGVLPRAVLLDSLANPDRFDLMEAFGHGWILATMEIRYVYRYVHHPGESDNPLQSDLIWSHWCFDEYAPPVGST